MDEIQDLKSLKKSQKLKLDQEMEALENEFHETNTRQQVQKLTGRVINGVLQGKIRRDKGGLLMGLLPLAWKQASALEGQHKPNVQILNINQNRLTVQMTDKDLDEYLSGDDGVKIEVMNRTQQPNEVQAITLQANDVNERKIKIEHNTIQSILRGGDTKIDKKQSLDLFGKCLADTKDKPEIETPEPNLADYSDMFAEGRAPQVADLPAGTYCILETEMVPHPTSPFLGLKHYKCVNCGKIYRKPKWEIKDLCPGKPKSTNSEIGSEL